MVRSKLKTYFDTLKAVESSDGKPTHIIREANIEGTRGYRILRELKDLGLITAQEVTDDRRSKVRYEITLSGSKAIRYVAEGLKLFGLHKNNNRN